ncbi:hypothetical protein [Caldimonas brevitalea]|uniref:Uncharacterized protein n=1 Tax=Caldimonas brevitalea TaxID=413882 RepID=A0A0G3BH84_9BURK|nr:hypothetical protein [Caldimonas brevitalea]AKJ26751.1 hypothetical protein AAW51_0060 [Caldimonas brevitalea]
MKTVAASAIASTVLAQHFAAQRESGRTGSTAPAEALSPNGSPAGLRQYQVLQSRSEPAQRTLAFKMR